MSTEGDDRFDRELRALKASERLQPVWWKEPKVIVLAFLALVALSGLTMAFRSGRSPGCLAVTISLSCFAIARILMRVARSWR